MLVENPIKEDIDLGAKRVKLLFGVANLGIQVIPMQLQQQAACVNQGDCTLQIIFRFDNRWLYTFRSQCVLQKSIKVRCKDDAHKSVTHQPCNGLMGFRRNLSPWSISSAVGSM